AVFGNAENVNTSCHHPRSIQSGLNRRRAIQYAAAAQLKCESSEILGRPVKPGDDSFAGSEVTASPAESKTRRCGRGGEGPPRISPPRLRRRLRPAPRTLRTGWPAPDSR